MDKDLRDDMLKLVRYKVLFVKREYEHAFPEREDLVSDNLDAAAFTAWKVAEFIQELGRGQTPVPRKWGEKGYPSQEHRRGGALVGLDEGDKKYLRVYYEVLERYPREKFKFEEQQIRVLEQIRDAVPKRAAPQPRGGDAAPAAEPAPAVGGQTQTVTTGGAFAAVGRRFDANKIRLKYLRQGFQLCSDRLSADVADAFAKFRDLGEFKGLKLTREELRQAFRRGLNAPFNPAGLESFPGRWKGVNRHYDFEGKEIVADAATWHMTWEKGVFAGDSYVQNVIGSKLQHFSSNSLPDLAEKKVDLALNVYRKDIGITGWLSAFIEFRNELALISYELHQGTFLWIGQVLSETGEPLLGEKVFWMFLEWLVPGTDKPTYYMYGLMFEIDFDECRARLYGDGFRKARFEYLG